MKTNPARQNLFEPIYIPTLDDLAEIDEMLHDLPYINMREVEDDIDMDI